MSKRPNRDQSRGDRQSKQHNQQRDNRQGRNQPQRERNQPRREANQSYKQDNSRQTQHGRVQQDNSKSKIFAIANAALGVLSILVGLLIVAGGALLTDTLREIDGGMIGGAVVAFGLMFALLGGVSVGISWGLLKFQAWAWYGGSVWVIIYLLGGLYGILSGVDAFSLVNLVIGIFGSYALWDEQQAYGINFGG